jgi:hypothetical protein
VKTLVTANGNSPFPPERTPLLLWRDHGQEERSFLPSPNMGLEAEVRLTALWSREVQRHAREVFPSSQAIKEISEKDVIG